jgi:hypothetical protein
LAMIIHYVETTKSIFLYLFPVIYLKRYIKRPGSILIVYHFTSNIDNNSLSDSTTHVKVFVPPLKPVTFF